MNLFSGVAREGKQNPPSPPPNWGPRGRGQGCQRQGRESEGTELREESKREEREGRKKQGIFARKEDLR